MDQWQTSFGKPSSEKCGITDHEKLGKQGKISVRNTFPKVKTSQIAPVYVENCNFSTGSCHQAPLGAQPLDTVLRQLHDSFTYLSSSLKVDDY